MDIRPSLLVWTTLATLLALPLAVAHHGHPTLSALVHNRTPTPDEHVEYECRGDETGPRWCFDIIATPSSGNFWDVRASTCHDDEKPSTCSRFTGSLRITIRDGRTADEVIHYDFVDGIGTKVRQWEAGDDYQYFDSSVHVEVRPLSLRQPFDGKPLLETVPPSGGSWYVWFVTTH